ncbi:chromate efflux transporter [Sphingorhabdus sp.]|uniref:chromate efflux transporter n=1 Tax=Sphingorhabdus sp. TaxID=1902408 RepID=UPI0032B81068
MLPTPSLSELTRLFGKIGLISFGGPAGQIALMHDEVVEQKQWVSEDEYLQALNLCHLLPGPEAQQLAAWIGWRLHGTLGGLIAGLLFVIPGALVMLGLSALYVLSMQVDWLQGLFFGIKAAVLAIVLQALLRIAGKALTTPAKRALAVVAFVALFALHIPFPLLILAAAVIGAVVAWKAPALFALKPIAASTTAPTSHWLAHITKTIFVWGIIWSAPMILILLTLGQEHVLWKVGAFFSQLAIVTFGGAYAVLAYMAQEAVTGFGWLSAGEMADGLGLAETTPGPLILVTQFVGFLAGFRAPDPFDAWTAGMLAALLTTWVTFAPCFLWIFAIAPLMERMRSIAWLQGSLAAITAAVVGVIANLSIWFALHVLFRSVGQLDIGVGSIWWPAWETLDVKALGIGLGAMLMLFGLKWGIIRTLVICAAAGLALGTLAA